MGLVSKKGIICLPEITMFPANVSSAVTMDAAGERIGNIIQILKAGNIRKVYFRTGTVTEEDGITVKIEGVSGGLPDGVVASSKAVTFADTDDTTWIEADLGAEDVVAVTQGQYIAVTLNWTSYADGNMTFVPFLPLATNFSAYMVTDITATPGTWAKYSVTQYIPMVLEYDDGSYAMNMGQSGVYATNSFNSSSDPDEIGNYMKIPYPCRAVGIWIKGDFDYDVTLSLLNASDTVLANCTLSKDNRMLTSSALSMIFFDSDPAASVTLAKDTWYRVIITPGADSVIPTYAYYPVANALDTLDLGTYCYWTQRTDGGSWTNITTSRVNMGLIIDQLDDGVGSGGGGGHILGRSLVR